MVRDKRHVTVKGRSPEEIWSTNQIWGCDSRLSRAELAREPSRAEPRFGHDLRVDDVGIQVVRQHFLRNHSVNLAQHEGSHVDGAALTTRGHARLTPRVRGSFAMSR